MPAENPAAPDDAMRRFARTRDPEALGDLFDATAPALLRVALSIALDPVSAENSVQETFLAVLETPERWDPSRPVMPWLLGILHRQVGKARRDGRRAPDPLRLPLPLRADDPADVAATREEQARIRAAIDGLPEPYRAVAVLRWRHGLDPADIADVRGEPPGTTRSLLSRALAILRDRFVARACVGVPIALPLGLKTVRRDLVARAAAQTGAGAASAGAGFAAAVVTAGGVVLTQKVVAVCTVLLVLAALTWSGLALLPGDRKSRDSAFVGSAGAAPDGPAAVRAGRVRGPAVETSNGETGDLPSPVNLDACDRWTDLHGVVVCESGAPVPGADVATVRYPLRRFVTRVAVPQAESSPGPATRSAADGTFVVRLPAAESLWVRASADGLAPAEMGPCRAGERVRLVLTRAVALRVTVSDPAGGAVAGARVLVTPRGDVDARGAASTGDDGVAGIGGLPAGVEVDVSVEAPGSATVRRRMRTPREGTAHVGWTVTRGRVLRGRVTASGSGAAIAGATVGIGWARRRAVVSDADGRFEIAEWGDLSDFDVHAVAAGFAGGGAFVEGRDEVVVTLRRAGSVEGDVVAEDGAPVPGARVTAAGWDFGGGTQRVSSGFVVAGPDGSFSIDGLDLSTEHVVHAWATGRGRTVVLVPPTAVLPGDAASPPARQRLVLETPRIVSGTLLDPEGRPVVRGGVSLLTIVRAEDGELARIGDPEETGRTDDLGRFAFRDVGAGRYELRAIAADGARGSRVVEVGSGDVAGIGLQMTGGPSRVRVTVRDERGEPVSGAFVGLRTEGDPVGASGLTDADGRVELRRAAVAATLRVMPPPDGGCVLSPAGAIDVAADAVGADVVLSQGGRVSGRVVGVADEPIPRARIHVVAAGRTVAETQSASDGSFRLTVPLGETVDLVFRGDGNRTGATDRTQAGMARGVRAGDTGVVVRVGELPRDRTLGVLVLSPDGVPVPRVGLRVSVPGDVRAPTSPVLTGADGRAEFAALPPVEVRVFADCVMRPDGHAWIGPAAGLAATPDGREVTLRLEPAVVLCGRIESSDGAPAAGLVELVRGDAPAVAMSMPGAGGAFVLIVPESLHGAFTLRLHRPGRGKGGSAASVDVALPWDGTTVVLRVPGGTR